MSGSYILCLDFIKKQIHNFGVHGFMGGSRGLCMVKFFLMTIPTWGEGRIEGITECMRDILETAV